MQIIASLFLVVALHLAVLDGNTSVFFWALLGFGALQVGGRSWGGSAKVGFALMVLALAGLIAVTWAGSAAAGLVYLPAILINALLLWVFGSSLRPGSLPLISRFRQVQVGWSTPEIDRYTKTLTVIWTGYFAICLLCAVILPFVVSAPIWSWVINVGAPGLSILFFLFEHLYRAWRLPHFGPVSIFQTIKTVSRPGIWRDSASSPL